MTSAFPADIKATSSATIRGVGVAVDGALFGKVEKDSIYVARTNAIVDAVGKAIERESDEVRRVFKEGWGKTTGADRHGADEFIEKQIVTEDSKSRYDVDKKTREVTYLFEGKLDKSRLLNVLGLTGNFAWKPLVFGLLRETTSASETVLDEATSVDKRKLQEAEGKLTANDDSTSKEEISQLKEKIRKTVERVTSEKKLTFGLSDVGTQDAFANQVQSTLQSLGFKKLGDSKQFDESDILSDEYATNPRGYKPSTLRQALEKAGKKKFDYVGVMTVDFSASKKSGLRGQDVVTAMVTGKILQRPADEDESWDNIANIDTKMFTVEGESVQDAKREAARQVAAYASMDMVAKIKNKGADK